MHYTTHSPLKGKIYGFCNCYTNHILKCLVELMINLLTIRPP